MSQGPQPSPPAFSPSKSVGRARALPQALAIGMRRFLATLCGLAALLSIVAFLARHFWIADLVVHFRPQYLALGLVAAGVFAWQRRPVLAALGSGVVLLNAGPVLGNLAPFASPLPTAQAQSVGRDVAQQEDPAGGARRPLRVAALNVFFANRNHAAVARWLESQDADVVVLVEITERWQRELMPRVPPALAHRRLERRLNRSGTLILSRWPLTDAVRIAVDPQRTPELVVTVQRPAAPFRLAAVHATWPLGKRLSALRNRELERLAEVARASPLPFVAAGDFNITPFSPHFVGLLERGQLRNAATGWQPTWPAPLAALGIQIDHLLVSSQVRVQDFRRTRVPGSDHLAVSATLRI